MLQRLKCALVVYAFVAATSLLAIAQPTVKPETVGLSAERLERIGAAVQKSIEGKQIAGAVTLVSRHGQVVWIKAQGMADREANKSMRLDTMFRICSMTKPITSVAVMMLYEEGKFLLDDPIAKYLPEFKNPRVLVKSEGTSYTIPAKREITIRDLLRHTSGITYHWNEDLGPYYRKANVAHGLAPYDGTIADSVKRLAEQPLLFNPGDKWEYGLSVDVLGRLVEIASGMPLDQFFRTRIFEPLGMADTYFYPPKEKLDRLATVYWLDDKGLVRFPDTPVVEKDFIYTADYPYNGPKTLFSGGAGLVSTAQDYLRFCQMLLDGGKAHNQQLLSRKSLELMTHDQLGKISADQDFGLGFGISGVKAPLSDLGTPGEFGWGGFYYTQFVIDPKEQMIVIFMSQLKNNGGATISEMAQTLAYQAIMN